MCRERKLAGRSVCFSQPPCALGSSSTFLHYWRVRYVLPLLVGDTGGGDCGVGVEGDEGGQKDTSWISSSHPRRTFPVWQDSAPGGLQLRVLRILPGVCSQQKHIESIANYEFSIHFILLPGVFSGDWSS